MWVYKYKVGEDTIYRISESGATKTITLSAKLKPDRIRDTLGLIKNGVKFIEKAFKEEPPAPEPEDAPASEEEKVEKTKKKPKKKSAAEVIREFVNKAFKE